MICRRTPRALKKLGSRLIYRKCHLCQGIVFLANNAISVDIVAQMGDILGLDECSEVALGVDLGDVVNLSFTFKSVG